MTHTLLVPAMYNLCLLERGFAAADLSAWRIGGFGGAPMPPATIARFADKLPALSLMNAYGATETTSPATLMPPSRDRGAVRQRRLRGPLRRDPGDGRGRTRAAARARRARSGCAGRWSPKATGRTRQATAESFVAGFWRSGDIGSIDAEGFVRVLDRSKDMINRGGYKIYSVEVENALMSHPAVVEAAVVAKPCEVLGERAHAFVTVDGRRRQRRCSDAALRLTARGLQGAGQLHAWARAAAAQRQRQADEAAAARRAAALSGRRLAVVVLQFSMVSATLPRPLEPRSCCRARRPSAAGRRTARPPFDARTRAPACNRRSRARGSSGSRRRPARFRGWFD